MGNRAVITTRKALRIDVQSSHELGVYLHWNGGRDSVTAFLKYCELKGYRSPEKDCYGWARLCQVIGNFFGGSTSIGIDQCCKLDCDNWDNGVYIIEDWKIVGRKYANVRTEQGHHDLLDMLIAINEKQPEDKRLSDEELKHAAWQYENEIRICSHCGADMSEGYCIGDGEDYYCSDECLEANMSREEYDELVADDNAYWTEWE